MMNVVMERAARASRDAFQMRQETDLLPPGFPLRLSMTTTATTTTI